jgi:hypothetical protein
MSERQLLMVVGLAALLGVAGCVGGPTECSRYAAALEECVDQFNKDNDVDDRLVFEEPECPAKGQEGRHEADVYACYTKVYNSHECLTPNDLTEIAAELVACGVDPEGKLAGEGSGSGGEDTGYRFDSGRFIE